MISLPHKYTYASRPIARHGRCASKYHKVHRSKNFLSAARNSSLRTCARACFSADDNILSGSTNGVLRGSGTDFLMGRITFLNRICLMCGALSAALIAVSKVGVSAYNSCIQHESYTPSVIIVCSIFWQVMCLLRSPKIACHCCTSCICQCSDGCMNVCSSSFIGRDIFFLRKYDCFYRKCTFVFQSYYTTIILR